MRDIKFRAPDGVTGQYVYFALCDLGTADDSFGLSLDLSQAEQFTGLKDKNGKEIYEGDIVKTGGHWSQYEKLTQVVEWDCVSVTPFNDTDWGWSPEHSEVIGNIHENPELI